jgi:hypothetical protein
MERAFRSRAWLSIVAAALSAACSSGGGSGFGGSAASGGTGGSSGTGANAGSSSVGGSAGSGATAGSGGVAGSASGGTSSSGGSGGSAGTGATGGTGGTGGASGNEICGNKLEDDSDGFSDCDDKDCFADSGCINGDLDLLKMSGFVPCGQPVAFTNADSDAICQKYALGWSPQFQSKCQFASYSGTVSFYCSPSPKTEVGVRWVVHGHVPIETVNGKLILWETLMGEYAFGNGGGSGMNPLHKFFDIQSTDHEEDFVGYQFLTVDTSTNAPYTNWFAIWDLVGGQKPQISGGFSVQIDAAQLFGTN